LGQARLATAGQPQRAHGLPLTRSRGTRGGHQLRCRRGETEVRD